MITVKNIYSLATLILLILSFPLISHPQEQSRGIAVKGTGQPGDITIDGNYWALIIGINDYPNLPPSMQLQAARPDAQEIASVLQKRYGFAKERMIQLYDKKASRDDIILALETLAATVSDKDSLLIYYAGHGEYNKNTKRGVWIPSDAVQAKQSTFVSNADIKDYLESIKARHIYTISDSCFSESLMGKTRSLGGDRAIKELYSARSRWILTSGGLYPVPDKAKGNHSTFAYHLLRLLEKNENQYLTPMQIINEIMPLVSNESPQTPKSAPVAMAGDEGGQFIFTLASFKYPETLRPTAPAVSPEDVARQKAEMKKMLEDRTRLEEDAKKLKEAEQRLRDKEQQMEKERVAKDLEQQRKMDEERRRIDREKREFEDNKKREKKKGEPVFVPPTF
ncbi:MAG: caspase family protein [Nitrospirota bacterium]